MATRAEILEAVSDEGWQQFRLSMKGKSTKEKLVMLERYYLANKLDQLESEHPVNDWTDVEIRVDNYIKALCRGGQLYAGETLLTMIEQDWKPRIRK